MTIFTDDENDGTHEIYTRIHLRVDPCGLMKRPKAELEELAYNNRMTMGVLMRHLQQACDAGIFLRMGDD